MEAHIILIIITERLQRFGEEAVAAMSAEMKRLVLDGRNWKTKGDFYQAFFKAVGAPSWHGQNFNALRDSITVGRINDVELPYRVEILGTDKMPSDVKHLVENFCELLKEFRSEGYEVDAICEK